MTKAKVKVAAAWFALMLAGFILINVLVVVGVVDTFIENMLVTIGINIILATG